jgi:hypothetical protein
MKRIFSTLLALSALAAASRADSEIVIAIRYLQAVGVSHSHLYLYRVDGKLLRQLTNDNSGQERNPLFSPDGTEIVFTRQIGAEDQLWSVEPLGKNLRRLDAAPEWYAQAKSSSFFTNLDDSPNLPPQPPEGQVQRYMPPDKSVEIICRKAGDDSDEVDGPDHGKNYLLRDLREKQEYVFGKMPGFLGAWDLLHRREDGSQQFLLEGPLRLAFCELHLDSMAGDTVFALDLVKHRFVRLGENWSLPIPLPGEPAFLVINDERYVAIPKSEKTANCSFIERWDANLEKVRYAKPGSAAISYGFSMYRPKGKPAVVCHLIPRLEP